MMLPWNTALDVEYVGQHSYNTLDGVNINAVDFGAAFLPAEPGSDARGQRRPRARRRCRRTRCAPIRGYGSINQQLGRGWRTYHSLQFSFNRRFANGFSFGFNDTIGLYDRQSTGARLQHNADGTWSYRADQAQADELLGNNNPDRAHDEGELRVGSAGSAGRVVRG